MGARRVILVESISKEGVMRRTIAAVACGWCGALSELDADQMLEAAEDFPYEIECVCGGQMRVFSSVLPMRDTTRR